MNFKKSMLIVNAFVFGALAVGGEEVVLLSISTFERIIFTLLAGANIAAFFNEE